ncbi:DNA fragmentation factor subunit beta-like [Ornithodoros turicata]|uniref:DNA fragmentation factor subunit beta-like n=1 Tax=Ornithodoros turicata TaxID=34597 RepID=UPI0031394AD8
MTRKGHSNSRPFVLQNVQRLRKLIVGTSVEDLLTKACAEFKLPRNDVQLLCEDGSEVDDEYLAFCSDYTVLTVLKSSEEVKYVPQKVKEHVEQMQKLLSQRDVEVSAAFAESDREKLVSILQKSAQQLEVPKHLVLADSRDEHPDWFRDLKNETSKKKVMRRKATSRIKGYYHKSKSDLLKNFADTHRPCLDYVFREFSRYLKENDANGVYFVRGERDALCTDVGLFTCEGVFDASECASAGHNINPYVSREHLTVFGTWNLDHGVERSRTILPAIKTAVEEARGRCINIKYFYKLLFTKENLKLVHPVCHLKTLHKNFVADRKHWYLVNETMSHGDSKKTCGRKARVYCTEA